MTGLLRSWVESANDPETEFPLNNLPYGVQLDPKGKVPVALITALGDRIVNLSLLEEEGVLVPETDFAGDSRPRVIFHRWNQFIGRANWRTYREALTELFMEGGNPALRRNASLLERATTKLEDVRLGMPFRVTEYTDFYAGRHHAENVGTMFRGPENALPPNWLHMPIGYNGRASSVVVSGTPVTRPHGQLKGLEDALPRWAPSERFDFELEMGAIVGRPSDGPLSVAEAFGNIFGYVLLNDWSARDIQAWEYQPLGPFQAKATATTISPWIVTAAALEPFRIATPPRSVPLLPYLEEPGPMLYDIALEAGLAPEGGAESVVTRTNMGELYYSPAQQLAHHASSGCPMRVGDLLGSGTISGPARENRGSMLELSWGGTKPVTLATGETRSFLEDGDTVTLRGAARGDGFRVGFGACSGQVLPARR